MCERLADGARTVHAVGNVLPSRDTPASSTPERELRETHALSSLLRALVPTYADLCVVHSIGEGGVLQRSHVEEGDARKAVLLSPLLEKPPSAADLRTRALIDENGRPMLQVEPTYVLAPLTVEGQIVGSLTLLTAEPGRHLEPKDIEHIREVCGRVAHALAESAQEQRAMRWIKELGVVLDCMLDGVLVIDRAGRVVLANESAARQWHVQREDLLQSVLDRREEPPTSALDGPRVIAGPLFARALQGDVVPPTERTWTGADGIERVFRVSAAPVRAEGIIHGVLVMVADITRAKAQLAAQRVEEARIAAVESEARYRSMIEAIPELVWTATADQTVDFCSRRWQQYTGIALDRLVGTRLQEVLHPDDLAPWLARAGDATQRKSGYELELRLRAASGAFRWHLLRSFPLCDADGNVTKWFGAAMDIDDIKRADLERAELRERERALRAEAESARLKDEFLARVSHELRAPLSAVAMWVHVLRHGDPADREAALDAIEQSASSQARLIDDLLDEARAQSGTLRVALEPVAPSIPIEGALRAMRPIAEKKGLRLEADLQDVGTIVGDARRLQQVMQNLLSNAIEFTPPGGRVEVRTERLGKSMQIIVKDTGEGIAAEFLPHLFEPFRQADASTSRRHSGLGLGLSIVRELVERHSGSVQAESEGPGKGSTFRVLLPLAHTASHPPPPPAGDEEPAPGLDGLSVLLVEDDDLTRDGLALVLEKRGARVLTAAAVSEAQFHLRSIRPDVLVCDIAMPGVDGYSFISKLRQEQREQPRLPAIALTAHSGPEHRARSLAAGFDLHLTKPVDLRELVTNIARCAGRVT